MMLMAMMVLMKMVSAWLRPPVSLMQTVTSLTTHSVTQLHLVLYTKQICCPRHNACRLQQLDGFARSHLICHAKRTCCPRHNTCRPQWLGPQAFFARSDLICHAKRTCCPRHNTCRRQRLGRQAIFLKSYLTRHTKSDLGLQTKSAHVTTSLDQRHDQSFVPDTLVSTLRAEVTASLPARAFIIPSRFHFLSTLVVDTRWGLSVSSAVSGMTNHVAMRTSTTGSAIVKNALSAQAQA